MVLKAFWGSLGLLLGALGGLLGGSWELFGASRSTKEGLQIRLGTLLGLVCSLLAAEDGLGSVLGLSWAPPGGSWGSLGSSLGPLDRPKGTSSFVLELPWASFARFLLPKMVVRAFWGRPWLDFDASGGVGGGVLVSVKSILTTKTDSGSFFVTSAS